ncbi:MAG: energy transducer TonB [Gemmatimonadota bacterium]|jgi:protein TonB
MKMPAWIHEAADGYRWLWKAQLRWGDGPNWWNALAFAARVAADLGRGTVAVIQTCAAPRTRLATAGITIEGRTDMAIALTDNSANERLKAAFDSLLWTSMLAAVVIHFATFAFWPEMTAGDISITRDIPTYLDLPPEVDIPDEPEALTRPALPVAAPVNVSDEVTIAPTTWDQNPVTDLLPPPSNAAIRAAAASSGFTPYTVAPRVLNTDEVVRAMTREYPKTLRDAGIGGTVNVIFSIDADGAVLGTAIGETSGYDALDRAALEVADVIRFSPALNRDVRVAVQVRFPIVFRVDGR